MGITTFMHQGVALAKTWP